MKRRRTAKGKQVIGKGGTSGLFEFVQKAKVTRSTPSCGGGVKRECHAPTTHRRKNIGRGLAEGMTTGGRVVKNEGAYTGRFGKPRPGQKV